MTTQRDRDVDTGLGALLQRSLLGTIWGRRTHRVSRGSSVEAGWLSWTSDDVIACTRDICTYIYETPGRFPAHTDTIHVPGVWLQTHHLENAYYEKYFRNGMTEAHQKHDERWHRNGSGEQ